ncbi:MAG TPA: hypothetical protein VFW87_04770 [Pirellulales bacterium]|nr:hypothetical protein [Pirellulales bacterium]
MQRERLEAGLLEQLKVVLANRDRAFLGRTHTVLQAIASTRADRAVPELIEAVDFTLDPGTFPVGVRRATSSFYPAAETLRTIGSKRVITEILAAAADKPPEDKVLRIYAWIVIEMVGKDAARAVVERGKIGRVPKQQQGILRLLKMIDEEPLLEMPPRKPVGKKENAGNRSNHRAFSGC